MQCIAKFCMKNILLIFFLVIGGSLFAQQLDQIGKKGGLRLSGGVGANAIGFTSDNEDSFRKPLSYGVSGNIALSVYGFNIPFTFSYSDAKFTHSGQPFNIVGLSPSYKNLTVHLGFRSMAFSSLTLAGHTFWGVGAEYKYKNFSIAAMGGRLLKAVEYDSLNTHMIPTYSRFGEGAKVSYAKDGNSVQFIVFYAKDDSSSIKYVPQIDHLKPQENMVYSIGLNRKVSEKITFDLEIASSAWNRDIRDDVPAETEASVINKLFLVERTRSTLYYNAYKTGLKFNMNTFSWGASYQRVEPGYRTLGAYNIANDFENITLNASTALFDKKVSLSGSGGFQHDDLDDDKESKMNRFVSSLSVNYKVSERLGLNAAYSGFNSTIKMKPIDDEYVENTVFDQLDTLNYIQLTTSLNAGLNYRMRETDIALHNISFNGSYQRADNEQGNNRFGSDMASASAGYSLSFKETGLSLGSSLNGNLSQYEEGQSVFAGLGVNGSVPLFQKKVNASVNGNVSNNFQDGELIALFYSAGSSFAYKFGKGHSANLSLRYSGRAKTGEAKYGRYNESLNEFTATIGYRYSFSVSK